MNNNNEIFEKKKFNSYNEITKVFDVMVIMNKDKTYSLLLKKKTGGTEPTDHELLLLILSKVEKLEEFQIKQEEFNARQEEFNAKQLEFNKYIASRIDNLVHKNNLKE